MTSSFSFMALAAVLSAQTTPPGFATHYLDVESDFYRPRTVAVSPVDGSIFVVAYNRVTKTDAKGNIVAIFDNKLGAPAAFVDADGNLLLAGEGRLQDLPVTTHVIGPSTSGAVVVRIDANLKGIVSAALIGGTKTVSSNFPLTAYPPAGASAVTTDAAGNVFVAGSTNETDFPVSSGAYLTSIPSFWPEFGVPVYAFVTKLSPDLSTVIYSTYYGCDRTRTQWAAATLPRSIVVDSRGAATFGGATTVNAPWNGNGSGTSSPQPLPFVARISPDGTALEASTSDTFNTTTAAVLGIAALALDGSGNTWAVGDALKIALITTGAYPGPAGSGYIAKLDSKFKVVFGTFLGDVPGAFPGDQGSSTPPITGMKMDPLGNIWLTGISRIQRYLPGGSSNSPGPTTPYIAELSGDGSLLKLLPTPVGGVAIAEGAGGSIVVLGSPDSFLVSDSTIQGGPFIVTSSANSVSSGTVAPGELVSLYGAGIGPGTPLNGVISDGVFANNLAGYQVFFNDIPAPLLYLGPYQINTVVPEELASLMAAGATLPAATLKVVGPNGEIDLPTVFVTASRPRIFSTALNEDGSVNSASNPAISGSIITIWATGLGYEDAVDGSIIHQPVSQIPISIVSSGQSLEVLYGSDAPETVLGLTQVNFRLPSAPSGALCQSGPGSAPCSGFAIQTPSATSDYAYVWTKAQ